MLNFGIFNTVYILFPVNNTW